MFISIALILLAIHTSAGLVCSTNSYRKFLYLALIVLPLDYFLVVELSILSFFKIFIISYFSLFCISALLGLRNFQLKTIDFMLVIFFIIIYLASALLNNKTGYASFARDFVPISFFIIAMLATNALKVDLKVDNVLLKKIIFFAVIFDFILYILAYLYNIVPSGIRGEFYLRTGILRYSDIFSLALYSLSSLFYFKFKGERVIWIAIMLLISIISLDRIFMIWSLIIAVHLLFSMRNILIKVAWYSILVIVLSYSYTLFSYLNYDSELLGRFLELLKWELLYDSLYERFVQPAILGGYENNLFTFLLGVGAGFEFYIPWFVYRDLNPYQISVDSFFVANFVKYGVLGAGPLLFLVLNPFFRLSCVAFLWVPVYLIVHNGILVDSFILTLVLLSTLDKSDFENES